MESKELLHIREIGAWMAPLFAGQRKQWNAADRRHGAALLVYMRQFLCKRGVRSIHDPSVATEVRQLWEFLVQSPALNEVSMKELGRICDLSFVARRTLLCGTAAIRGNAERNRLLDDVEQGMLALEQAMFETRPHGTKAGRTQT